MAVKFLRQPQNIGVLLAALLAGCGDDEKIVPVTGVLMYKGTPVANAYVDFVPEHGRPSLGQTDAEGRFTLKYDPQRGGALVGKHKVSARLRPTTPAEQEAQMLGKRVPMSKDLSDFFDKYGPEKSTKEVEISKGTKELRLDWD